MTQIALFLDLAQPGHYLFEESIVPMLELAEDEVTFCELFSFDGLQMNQNSNTAKLCQSPKNRNTQLTS